MRWWALVGVVVLAACSSSGGSSHSGAFPGDAHAKAAEVVRRADADGVPHGPVGTIAGVYGTDGASSCRYKDAAARRDAEAMLPPLPSDLVDPRFPMIVVEVYCPWLL